MQVSIFKTTHPPRVFTGRMCLQAMKYIYLASALFWFKYATAPLPVDGCTSLQKLGPKHTLFLGRRVQLVSMPVKDYSGELYSK